MRSRRRTYRQELQSNLKEMCGRADEVEPLFYHAIAILHAPEYRSENASALRQDWPRVPLASTTEQLEKSAQLGKEIAALLDPETPVEGVTAGQIRSELSMIGVISREGGGTLDPQAGDLDVAAGWGYRANGGAVMPGKGRVVLRD